MLCDYSESKKNELKNTIKEAAEKNGVRGVRDELNYLSSTISHCANEFENVARIAKDATNCGGALNSIKFKEEEISKKLSNTPTVRPEKKENRDAQGNLHTTTQLIPINGDLIAKYQRQLAACEELKNKIYVFQESARKDAEKFNELAYDYNKAARVISDCAQQTSSIEQYIKSETDKLLDCIMLAERAIDRCFSIHFYATTNHYGDYIKHIPKK